MRPTWLQVDGLRTRLVLVFIAIVVIIAGATAGVVSFMARSWIYSNAQDVATAQFRDELQYVNGTPVDELTPANLQQIFQSDMTLIVDGEVIRQGSVDAATIPPSFDEGLDSPKLIRFERLDSQRIMLGMSVNVVDMSADDSYDNETLVKAVTIRPLVGVQDKFDDLLRAVGLTLAAGVLVSGLLGLWIASTLVRPLKRLDKAAARAADGDLSVRLPEDGVAELAQVTTTFNNMVARNEAVIRGLEESEEQSRRFVADVSHELRTPLAALVPVSEILREEIPNLPPDAAAAARIVSSEIGKLTRLVEDLIEMSRHDSQQAHLVLDDVDLVELTERTLESRGWTDYRRTARTRKCQRQSRFTSDRHCRRQPRRQCTAPRSAPGSRRVERRIRFLRHHRRRPRPRHLTRRPAGDLSAVLQGRHRARTQRGQRTRTLARRRERAPARRHHRRRPGGWSHGLHGSPAPSLTPSRANVPFGAPKAIVVPFARKGVGTSHPEPSAFDQIVGFWFQHVKPRE